MLAWIARFEMCDVIVVVMRGRLRVLVRSGAVMMLGVIVLRVRVRVQR